MRKFAGTIAVAASVMVMAGAALGAVLFDPDTGTGFVGKGDVQLVYGWNNKALQDNAHLVDFRANSVSETSWTCTKPQPTPNDPDKVIVQERSRTTTTQGLIDEIARENSKGKLGPITGFNLLGYAGDPTVVTDGPAVGSCPANPAGFEYDDNAETVQLGGGIEVSINGTNWYAL
jgi:hypothetical protein